MKKTRLEKGITLIALIITIIILLILAVVTIKSIKDSKIIGYSQDAASEHTVAQEKEQLGLALSEWQIQKVIGGKTFKEVVSTALSGTAAVEENADGTLTVIMNKTGNQYIVKDNGDIIPGTKSIMLSDATLSIIKGKTKTITATVTGGLKLEDVTYSSSSKSVATVSQSGEITAVTAGEATITATCGDCSVTCKVTVREANDLDYYFFGQDLEGRIITTILNTTTGAFSDDPLTALDESDTNVIRTLRMEQEGSIGVLYFVYQGEYYKARANMNTGFTDADYGAIIIIDSIQTTRVGKNVSFAGNLWTIIYDDNINGLQMVSGGVYKYDNDLFYLGYKDSLIDNWSNLDNATQDFKIADIDNNGNLTDNNKSYEKSIYSYNKAIESLNKACESLFKDSTNNSFKNSNIEKVRCVGSNPIDINSENKTLYTSDNLKRWPVSNENYPTGMIDGRLKGSDENYVSDLDRMSVLNIVTIEESKNYYLASRSIIEKSDKVYFNIRNIRGSFLYDNDVLSVDESYVSALHCEETYLRPVICLKSDTVLTASSVNGIDYILE